MVTSRKYLTMNIRRPNSVLETAPDTTSTYTQRNKLQLMSQPPKLTSYLPTTKSNYMSGKHLTSNSASLASSSNSNSKTDLKQNDDDDEEDHEGEDDDNDDEEEEAEEEEEDEETIDSRIANRLSRMNLEKKKLELSNKLTSRITMCKKMDDESANKPAKASFYNMGDTTANKQQQPYKRNYLSSKNELNISNVTNIQATFERYDSEQPYFNTSQSNNFNFKGGENTNSSFTVKYSTPVSALPSKPVTSRIGVTQPSKPSSVVTDKSSKTVSKANLEELGGGGGGGDKKPSPLGQNLQQLRASSFNCQKLATAAKEKTFKSFLFKPAKKTNAEAISTSTQNFNTSINSVTNRSDIGSKYRLCPKPVIKGLRTGHEAKTDKSTEETNTVLIDQMASFIDELKDFIDDRLIDTTSQLEMANQRISGLYFNLNYLTKEFIDLKTTNEQLKAELLYNNKQTQSKSPTGNSYYHKLNVSRRKNNRGSLKFDKTNSQACDNGEAVISSSSKTSSIETTSSSASESLTISQTALTSLSPVDAPINLMKDLDNANRNGKELSKLESTSSSVNSINFYENTPIANRFQINWPDLNATTTKSRYLRTSSQIGLNMEYADFDGQQQEDHPIRHMLNSNANDIILSDLNQSGATAAAAVPADSLFFDAQLNKCKAEPKQEAHSKLMHQLHANIIPYTNFRDFDAQYSWDYTDNLVNKLISAKIDSINNGDDKV